jgi:transposase-like protein
MRNRIGFDMSRTTQGQHFLLSAKARTLSLAQVMRLSDDQAWATFKDIQWASTGGDPVCPRCGNVTIYALGDGRRFKCGPCAYKFSVTAGTIFASRKMSFRDILGAIAIFVNGAKGHSALQLSRDLNCQYKTAFVMAHKLREALAAEHDVTKVGGEVEVDGAHFGGYVKPANHKENRVDRRLAKNRNGKRQVVVVMRERGGRTKSFVAQSEAASVSTVMGAVAPGSKVFADEASSWDALHGRFDTKRINHTEAYSTDEACTNWAESFFSRIRRAEMGIHHHIAGKYLNAYAAEMSWREDNRRVSNGAQFLRTTGAALAHPVSRQWKGYWQRSAA